MNNKLSRRDFIRLSAAAGAGAALAASGLPMLAQDAIDLRFVWWGGQLRADITTQVINMFVEQNPNVNFTYEFLGFEEYWTKLTTQAAGGGLPDIMQHGSTTLVEWARNGLLSPLDEYIEAGVIDFTNVPEVLQQHGAVDGQIYAVSAGSNANGFAVDLDAFEEAGIEVPPDTWTWGDFENVVLELHEKLGIWGFGDYLHHVDIWRIIYGSLDTQLYTEDGTALAYTDDQPLIDHMHMILRLQDAGAIPSLAEESEVQSPETAFSVTKRSAIDWLAGSNQLVAMWTAGGEDRRYKILPLPRVEGGMQGTAIRLSQFVALTSHSANPEAAAQFINFFTNDIEANKVLNAERGVPINSEVLEALGADAEAPQQAVYDYLARLGEDSAPLAPLDPLGVEDIRTNVYYPEFADPVRYGMITPEEGVAILRERANAILAEANA